MSQGTYNSSKVNTLAKVALVLGAAGILTVRAQNVIVTDAEPEAETV